MSDKTALSCYNMRNKRETTRVLRPPRAASNHTKGKFRMATPHATPIQLPLPLPDATVEIPLSRGLVTVVDVCDADLALRRWHASPSSRLTYAKGADPSNTKRTIALHRIVLERKLGRGLIKGEYVDHIDGDPMNNTRANLRLATIADNNRNRALERRNTSGFKGVSRTKSNRWLASISVNNKDINLGRYDTPEEAHEAYKQAALKYFGEFARFE